MVDIHNIMNSTASSNQSLNSKENVSISPFLFVKGLVNRPGFGSDSSIMNLIKHVKEPQIIDCYNRII